MLQIKSRFVLVKKIWGVKCTLSATKTKFPYMRFLLSNKVSTLLGNTAGFFFAYSKRKLLFQPFEVGWLSPKLAAILVRPKWPSDVTSCITLMPHWKFRVIMGEEDTVWSPPKNILRTSQSWKAHNNSGLRHEEVESQSWGFSVYLIGYFQDTTILCKQANECEYLNRKMIGTLGKMASTQLNNIYTHKVKKTWKQEKAAFENIIRKCCCVNHSNKTSSFGVASLQGNCRRFVSFTVDEIVPQWPIVQWHLLHPTSYHNSNNLINPLLLYEGANLKL